MAENGRAGSHLVPMILQWPSEKKDPKGQRGQEFQVHTYPTVSSRPRGRRVQSLVQIDSEMWICISSIHTYIHTHKQTFIFIYKMISGHFGIRHEHGIVLFHNVRNDLKSRITYIETYYIVVEISKKHHNHISRRYVLYPLYFPELYLNTSINSDKLLLNWGTWLIQGVAIQENIAAMQGQKILY